MESNPDDMNEAKAAYSSKKSSNDPTSERNILVPTLKPAISAQYLSTGGKGLKIPSKYLICFSNIEFRLWINARHPLRISLSSQAQESI
jgi:hypothetical protein